MIKTLLNLFKKKAEDKEVNYNQEFLYVGHFVKYNLYLLCKSIIFSSLCSKFATVEEATQATHNVIQELDLDSKPKN